MQIKAIWDDDLELVPSDTHVEKWAEEIVRRYNRNKHQGVEVRVCSDSALLALRLQVIKGKIKPNELVFVYKDNLIEIDELAQLVSPPKSFAGAVSMLRWSMLMSQAEKAEFLAARKGDK